MVFGDPHIGKAIELIRKASGLTQKQLATLIHAQNSVVSKYESGESHIPEDKLARIAAITRHELIEIMDKAFAIYRFNYCRVVAERTGEDLESVIARYDRRARFERHRAAYEEYDQKRREFEKQNTELLFLEKGEGFTILREIVETKEEREARKQANPRKKPENKKEPQ